MYIIYNFYKMSGLIMPGFLLTNTVVTIYRIAKDYFLICLGK